MLLNVSIICNSKKTCSNYREILNVPSDVHGGFKSTNISVKTGGRNDTEYLKSYDEIQALTRISIFIQPKDCPVLLTVKKLWM